MDGAAELLPRVEKIQSKMSEKITYVVSEGVMKAMLGMLRKAAEYYGETEVEGKRFSEMEKSNPVEALRFRVENVCDSLERQTDFLEEEVNNREQKLEPLVLRYDALCGNLQRFLPMCETFLSQSKEKVEKAEKVDAKAEEQRAKKRARHLAREEKKRLGTYVPMAQRPKKGKMSEEEVRRIAAEEADKRAAVYVRNSMAQLAETPKSVVRANLQPSKKILAIEDEKMKMLVEENTKHCDVCEKDIVCPMGFWDWEQAEEKDICPQCVERGGYAEEEQTIELPYATLLVGPKA